MNPLFIIIIVLLLGGGNTKRLSDVLKNIDFNSFKPIFKLLGLNENFTEFICSENFSKFLDDGFDIRRIPELLPYAKEFFKSINGEKKDENADEKTVEYLGLEPIKEVASSEIEENLGSFFS